MIVRCVLHGILWALCVLGAAQDVCALEIHSWAFEATVVGLDDPAMAFGDVRLGDPVQGSFAYDVSREPESYSELPLWADYVHPAWFQGIRLANENPRTGYRPHSCKNAR